MNPTVTRLAVACGLALALQPVTALAQNAQDTQDWQPVDPPMITRWAKDIDPQNPLPEYPRPQMTRDAWQNLNGLWNYAVTGKNVDTPDNWDGEILVPYPIESALSGVKKEFLPDQTLWYERTFEVPDDWDGQHVILHFGAVDYATEVFVNGQSVGTHEGGYDPFSFDITDALDGDGEQMLRVKVTDPTWTKGIPRGKQTLNPGGIMYTPTSGIWQTVWLEPVAEGGIEDLHIVPDLENNAVKVTADLYDGADGEVTVSVDGESVTGQAGETITVPVEDPELWTPDNPHLYDLSIEVARDGETIDEVESYFGMRSIELAEVDGVQRLLLNGEPVFQFGPLDQGFWPAGIYTAPTDEALRYDLEVTKELGYNMTRKHIKVEPARWYYHADQLGLLVWQDMPSINSYDANQVPSGFPEIDKAAFERELRAMIDNLENHPSIVMWVIFNEHQGQHDTEKYVRIVEQLDPTRLINQGSGGGHHGVGDIYDHHPYPAPRLFEHPDDMAFALGEYGGIGLMVGDNPWHENAWGYTTTQTAEELENLYAQYAGLIGDFKDNHGLAAAVYTQITDVEIETNGLLTYDRKLKVDPEWIAKANHFEWAGPTYEPIVPSSQEESQQWTYTFSRPSGDWTKANYNASNWQTGPGGFGTEMTPNTGVIGTEWNGDQIWLRRTFNPGELTDEMMKNLVLHQYHDEDVQIYLNGVLAYEADGFISGYQDVPLSDKAKAALRPDAENVLAVTCRQTTGGQYIDVGLGVRDPNRD